MGEGIDCEMVSREEILSAAFSFTRCAVQISVFDAEQSGQRQAVDASAYFLLVSGELLIPPIPPVSSSGKNDTSPSNIVRTTVSLTSPCRLPGIWMITGHTHTYLFVGFKATIWLARSHSQHNELRRFVGVLHWEDETAVV